MAQSSLAIGVQVQGADETIEAMRGVKYGVGNRVLTSSLRKQASKASKFAKAGLKGGGRTGLLGKSIGVVYRKPRRAEDGGGVFVIGPRKSFATTIGYVPSTGRRIINRVMGFKAKKSPKLGKKVVQQFQGKRVDPTKYAHLVEGGRAAVGPHKKRVMSDGTTIFGRRAAAVQAKPFMKPAAVAIQTSGQAEIAADIQRGLSQETAKYASKGKSIYGG